VKEGIEMFTRENATTILTEVLNAHRHLLSSEDLDAAVTRTLEKVGNAAQVDRVYVFRNYTGDDGVVYTSQQYEWTASSVDPQIDNPDLQDIPLREAGYSRWLDSFLANKPIYGNISDFPEDEQPTLDEQGILSLLILPIYASGSLWGFVGFDDCTRPREWSEAELDLLSSLTIALGTAFSRNRKSELEKVTMDLIGLIGRMLEVHAATFSETALETVTERTQARVSALVKAHQFFMQNSPAAGVPVVHLIDAIKPYLETIRGCEFDEAPLRDLIQLDIEPLSLSVDRAMDLILIIAEVISVLTCRGEYSVGTARLVISLHSADGRGQLTFTAIDKEGLPVAPNAPLDGMAFLMIRRLQEHLRAKQVQSDIEGLLFRLSFPLDEGDPVSN
jgi:two-component sensor histidine kinase